MPPRKAPASLTAVKEDNKDAAMYRFYIQQYQIYREKYGPQTAIFLQVGKFYEFYDIQEHGETQANVREIVDLLGVQLSRKQVKGLGADQECLFAGVPDAALHRWSGRLTILGWTIVVFDQVKDARDNVVSRQVSRILTPSTHIEAVSSAETPYILTVVLHQTVTSQAPRFGAALVDLTTGTTKTYTGQAHGRADLWTADDLIQLMSVYPPREVLVFHAGAVYAVDTLRRVLCLSLIHI
jgi:DNA mismatch repair protein MutS